MQHELTCIKLSATSAASSSMAVSRRSVCSRRNASCEPTLRTPYRFWTTLQLACKVESLFGKALKQNKFLQGLSYGHRPTYHGSTKCKCTQVLCVQISYQQHIAVHCCHFCSAHLQPTDHESSNLANASACRTCTRQSMKQQV